jgi:phage terminase large subunit-like protein
MSRAVWAPLAEIYERQRDDPLWRFQPTAKQRPFIEAVITGQPTTCLFAAGNRSGKSLGGAYCGAMLARFGLDPPRGAYSRGGRLSVWERATAGWVVALDYPVARDVIQPLYFDNGAAPRGSRAPFIPPREIESWRQDDQVLRLRNGSRITFRSADSGREKFQGAEKDWVHIDEEPPMPIFEECAIRIGAHQRLRTWITATLLPPAGHAGGLSWMLTELIRPWERGEREDLAVFGASIYDNPHLAREEIVRLEAMWPPGSLARRIRLNGEWVAEAAGTRAYPAFSSGIHVRPQPGAVRHLPLGWTWDFNVEPMVSLVFQHRQGRFYVLRELMLDQGSVAEMVELFLQAYPTHGAEVWIYGDATGKARTHQTAKSDWTLILEAMRRYPVPVRLKVPEANPAVVDRLNALNRGLRDEEGGARIEVDPTCRELIKDLEGVLADPRGAGIKKSYMRGDPYARRTHASDALGYAVIALEPVVMWRRGPLVGVRVPTPSYGPGPSRRP